MSEIETSWHSYPKALALGHAAIVDLLQGDVVVQEKVDGSQFSFGRFGDTVRVRSKGKEMPVDAPEKMFNAAVETVTAIATNLIDGYTYRGEYLQKPKHNALAYDRIPKGHVILFDINTGYEKYAPPEYVADEAERLGLEAVPLLTRGKIDSAEQVASLLETVSVLGGQKIEGVVIKNYARFGRDGKCLMGKYVSEAFKEVHAREWAKENPTAKDIVGLIGESLRTPARWNKAVQHLAERGELTNSPKDIGPLIREAQADVEAECEAEIKEQLYKWAKPHIVRTVIRGLPEFYKEKLLASQFAEPNKTP